MLRAPSIIVRTGGLLPTVTMRHRSTTPLICSMARSASPSPISSTKRMPLDCRLRIHGGEDLLQVLRPIHVQRLIAQLIDVERVRHGPRLAHAGIAMDLHQKTVSTRLSPRSLANPVQRDFTCIVSLVWALLCLESGVKKLGKRPGGAELVEANRCRHGRVSFDKLGESLCVPHLRLGLRRSPPPQRAPRWLATRALPRLRAFALD